MLKNILEDALRRLLPEVYAVRKNLCPCSQCQEDVLALALRSLPPKYVSREVGEVFARLELENPQAQVDMLEALLQAADIVIARPRCARAKEAQRDQRLEHGT
ncbi:MAG: late competence development ComFB family protein [Candidatus Caldatribacterium sp.]|uniref:late competence development ComFB family protein n=1 Tax=Candidatus Caldatribacterium sp. TaxID=2282143 RepID=UPI002992DFFA|nr:late competence development ComFB family protein [Candidatus Caldatribacterium sp.]MCX7730830.1 late competence development ComFB family protein [Candidatus Caldatribacterium sp.]MDW8081022.1 late competence development ComFB family protein [Candidatus Calescibacterium sp.]